MDIHKRLAELGLRLPDPPAPRGDYVPAVIHAGVVSVSGQVSRLGETTIRGPVTKETSRDVLRLAGEACVLRALSVLDAAAGGLDNVQRILFVRGFVNAQPDFEEHSRVLDEVSRLLLAIFGENGRHGRSALGVSGLPSGGLLEIELTAAIGEP